MITSKRKVQIAMARACMGVQDILTATGMPMPTIYNVIGGKRSMRPEAIGQVAKALQVDVLEILEDSEE